MTEIRVQNTKIAIMAFNLNSIAFSLLINDETANERNTKNKNLFHTLKIGLMSFNKIETTMENRNAMNRKSNFRPCLRLYITAHNNAT